MTFTYKLSNRLALLRDAALAAVVTLGACQVPSRANLPPPPGTPSQLVVTPPAAVLRTNETTELRAVALDVRGDTVSASVRWSATGGTITDTATSGGVSLSRYHSPATPGAYRVTARAQEGSASDTAGITVIPVPVATVSVTPGAADLAAGATAQLTATVTDSSGGALTGRVVTWASNNPGVATVNTTGLVRAVAAGLATITATSEGKSGSAAITATSVPVASVTVAPSSASVQAGATVQLAATPRDASGAALSGRVIAWSSGNPSVATASGTGLVTGVVTGSATITATSEGIAGTAAVTVTAPPPPPPPPPGGAVPVFPGAEGFGTTTRAGRGGQVIRVTNLNDAGPGSFRAAVQTAGPRTVIFDVSGTITLSRDIFISDAANGDNPADGTKDFLTVAGQTAPSPGITIRGGGIVVRASDVLIQHLRIRVGDVGILNPGTSNAIAVIGGRRVVIDHVSASWATDQVAQAWAGARDVTFSNCVISEGLLYSIHPKGAHSYGLLIGGNVVQVSIVRSLLAHNWFRNPVIEGGTRVVTVNNFIYNPGVREVITNHGTTGNNVSIAPSLGSIIGNAGRGGPSSNPPPATRIRFYDDVVDTSRFYVSDNAFQGPVTLESNPASLLVAAPPFALPSPLTILPSSGVEAYVKANAGARPLDRDAVDIRIMNEITTGSGSLIDSPSQVGGWPTLAQNQRVLNIPANHAEVRASGYTVLEEDILFPMARAVQP